MQARSRHTEQLADLADVVMAVSRAIKVRTAADPLVIDLSATEVTVLRYIDHHPGVSPSAVAAATGQAGGAKDNGEDARGPPGRLPYRTLKRHRLRSPKGRPPKLAFASITSAAGIVCPSTRCWP